MHNKNPNKIVFLWMHSRKLLNQYFFKDRKYLKLNTNFQLFKGFFLLFYISIYQKYKLVNFHQTLPKVSSLKNFLINFYSLIFFSLLKDNFKNAIFVIGDINYPIYKSLLLSSTYLKNIDVWIIYQGTGAIEKKLDRKYPNNVKKIFIPFAKDSFYENMLLKKSKVNKKIEFLNIDTTLKISLSKKNNNLAIFQGYNKDKKLYPLYFFKLVKYIYQINNINDINKFDSVCVFLHPRLNFIKYLNFFILNKKVKYKIFNNKKDSLYKYIISYSPTINSSLSLKLKSSKNVFMEVGVNFNRKNIQDKISTFLKKN